jgi:hypothetical protein
MAGPPGTRTPSWLHSVSGSRSSCSSTWMPLMPAARAQAGGDIAVDVAPGRGGRPASIQNDSGLPQGPAGTFRGNLGVR